MLDILLLALFVWLFVKALGLAFRVAWGAARVAATVLFVLALPLLALCLVFAGGLLLLVPITVLAIAFGILKACA